MIFKAEKILQKSIANVNGYTCPAIEVSFMGKCPNLKCPANVSSRNTNDSGCFYEHKNTPGIIGVARWLGIKTNDAKYRYQQSIKKTEKFTNFYTWLINYRESVKPKHCPQCGVASPHQAVCLNRKRCEKRQAFVAKCMQRFPFNIKTLNIHPVEFWAAANNEVIADFALTDKQRARANLLQSKLGAK